jgi:hypothetical protein
MFCTHTKWLDYAAHSKSMKAHVVHVQQQPSTPIHYLLEVDIQMVTVFPITFYYVGVTIYFPFPGCYKETPPRHAAISTNLRSRQLKTWFQTHTGASEESINRYRIV